MVLLPGPVVPAPAAVSPRAADERPVCVNNVDALVSTAVFFGVAVVDMAAAAAPAPAAAAAVDDVVGDLGIDVDVVPADATVIVVVAVDEKAAFGVATNADEAAAAAA